MKKRSRPKTMIIGLDGATFDVILPLIERNKLPTFAHLLEKGAWGELESTIPPITAAAWPSFMTGENPGKHGILSFLQSANGNKATAEDSRVVSSNSFAGRTFFDVMAANGKRVAVITVPVTYPPWDINGVMISGYPCPDNDKIYCSAKDIALNLKEPLNFSAEYYRISSEEQIIEDCLYRDNLRAELSFDLLDRYDFDCFAVVLGGIDRAQHDFWKYCDPDYPNVRSEDRDKFKNAIYRNYKLADHVIGRFLATYGDDTNLFVISDHGAGRHPFHFFNVNSWLRHKGYLEVRTFKALTRELLKRPYRRVRQLVTPDNKKTRPSLQKMQSRIQNGQGDIARIIDWQNTKAFHFPLTFPTGGIMINRRNGKTGSPIRSQDENSNLIDSIIDDLSNCYDGKTGEKIVNRVFRRENIYSGRYTGDFPDIIYELNTNYASGNEIFGPEVSPVSDFQLSKKSGLHLMNGIFFAHGPQIEPGQIHDARIIDVAPTILYNNDMPIPDELDGVILRHIFNEQTLKDQHAQYVTWNAKTKETSVFLEEYEDEQMKDKLRSLGYL